MKQGIHPEYGPVAFRDRSTGRLFLTRSTLVGRTDAPQTVVDGVESRADRSAPEGRVPR